MLNSKKRKIEFLLEVITDNNGYGAEVKRHARRALADLGVQVDIDEKGRYERISREVDIAFGAPPYKKYGCETETSKILTKFVLIVSSILLGVALMFAIFSLISQSDTKTTQTIESTTESSGGERTL